MYNRDKFDERNENHRIDRFCSLVSPKFIKDCFPLTFEDYRFVIKQREDVENIISKKDDRFLVIVGPCSIHDIDAAIDYAQQLYKLKKKFEKNLFILMRTYFEKPRTIGGWKGFINDPNLDASCQVNKGLLLARSLLIAITRIGLGVACEFLDTITPQYFTDLITYGAIGARTSECQLHRNLASGLSMPIGFKNGTTGDVKVAIDAVLSAKRQHAFIGITSDGVPAVVHSNGNPFSHIILRGGRDSTNYSSSDVEDIRLQLKKNKLKTTMIIDCSHGNSKYDYKNQMEVISDVAKQIREEFSIRGVMIESNICEGSQTIPCDLKENIDKESSTVMRELFSPKVEKNEKIFDYVANTSNLQFFQLKQEPTILSKLKYGVSITDGCINIEDTEKALEILSDNIDKRFTSD